MKNFMILLCCVGVLLLVYVASYSLDVRRGNKYGFLVRLAGHYEEGQQLPVSASYGFGGRWAETIFSPMHSLDRSVRSNYWNLTFHESPSKP